MSAQLVRASLFVLSFASTAFATDRLVTPGQSIQTAIVAASAGDRVLVAPGVYAEAIDFLGKDIQVIGTSGANVTTIDATGLGTSVARFTNKEPQTALLRGFRMTGGTGTSIFGSIMGGGVFTYGTAIPTIEECIIEGNSVVSGSGGGAYLFNNGPLGLLKPILRRCIVRNNHAASGGGAMGGSIDECRFESNTATGDGGGVNADVSVTRSRFVNNSAGGNGGGIYASSVAGYPLHVFESSTFTGNSAVKGGGIYWEAPESAGQNSGIVRFCRFDGNSATIRGGGIYIQPKTSGFQSLGFWGSTFRNNSALVGGGAATVYGGFFGFAHHCVFDANDLDGSTVFADSCIFLNHSNPMTASQPKLNFSISPVLYSGVSSFSANPAFVDPANGDYHLMFGSPAIDAGGTPGTNAPTIDYEGDAFQGTADIGADERVGHLYLHGDAAPGAAVTLRVVGQPGEQAYLLLSASLAGAPIPTAFGPLGLGLPLAVGTPILLGAVPASGVIDIPAIVPITVPNIVTVHAQALLLQSATVGAFTNVESVLIL